MSLVEIKISCTAKGTAFWLALDKTDLRLVDGEVTLKRSRGKYYLVWWMVGAAGNTITVEITIAGTKTKIVDSKIPAGRDKAAGVAEVEVK